MRRKRARPGCSNGSAKFAHEGKPIAEIQVREARLTDIDRVRSLIERTDRRWSADDLSSAADLLRQLVYLPNAAILVAFDGKQMLGVAVLSLRPSIAAGGLVGTLDMLAIEPGHERTGVAEALISEVVRSARNKGCRLVEAAAPGDPADTGRYERLGFADAAPRLSHSLANHGARR